MSTSTNVTKIADDFILLKVSLLNLPFVSSVKGAVHTTKSLSVNKSSIDLYVTPNSCSAFLFWNDYDKEHYS